MKRILVVVRGAVDVSGLRSRFAAGESGPAEIALCYVLEPGKDGLEDGLRAQRHVTALLRQALGNAAETIAVLVASERQGNTLEDCARAWGATLVRT